jgi:iron complex transport system substrate-binding protein
MRIVSFLPSATEILFAIGAGEQVVGVTFECDYPAAARALPQVVFSHLPPGLTPAAIDAVVSAEGAKGRSLYFVDLPRLEALRPELIVLQDLCRVCAIDSPTLARDMVGLGGGSWPAPSVVSLSAHSLAGVFEEIRLLGTATGCGVQAAEVVTVLTNRVEAVRSATRPVRAPRVLCLEWLDPLFQGGHWIPEMVALAGGDPVLATAGEKSVRITWEQVVAADPEIIVVMPCGYHLEETMAQFEGLTLPPEWSQLSAVRRGEVYAVDGTAYFSRPGPRLVDGLEILAAILGGKGLQELPAESVRRISCHLSETLSS